jgi:hypothetical protein
MTFSGTEILAETPGPRLLMVHGCWAKAGVANEMKRTIAEKETRFMMSPFCGNRRGYHAGRDESGEGDPPLRDQDLRDGLGRSAAPGRNRGRAAPRNLPESVRRTMEGSISSAGPPINHIRIGVIAPRIRASKG